MSEELAYATYLFGVFESLFYLGAAVYAYRLTKLTGAFGAWILLITALVILASHSVSSLVTTALQVPFGQLVSSTDRISSVSFLLSNGSDLLLSVLQFSAM